MRSRRKSGRRRRRLLAAGGTAAALLFALLLAASHLAIRSSRNQTATLRKPAQSAVINTPATSSPAPAPMAIGLYAGPGQAALVDALAATFASPVTVGFDYLDGTSWATISDPSWTLARWGNPGRPMIWGVPMLPASGGSLGLGAAGLYDAQFARLARVLLADGQGGSTLMLGWDPEGSAVPWSVSTPSQAAQYVAYWQQIVTTMRSVAGTSFQFEWDVASADLVPPSNLYPGDSFVNIVASDVVDTTAGPTPTADRWAVIAGEPFGLEWFAAFARIHQRRFAVANVILTPAAAPGGGGDDPLFIEHLLQWASSQQAADVVLWDYGTIGIANGSFPKALGVVGRFAGDRVPVR